MIFRVNSSVSPKPRKPNGTMLSASRRLEFALEFHLERVSFEVYALNGGVRLVEPLVESLLIRVQAFAQDVYLIHQRFVA